MSDDRAVAALERRMNRPLVLACASLVITMGVFLAGFTVIVGSTNKVSFPSSVAVTTQTPPRGSAPVSYAANVVGRVSPASLVRGGQAADPATAAMGVVGFRKTSASVQRLASIGGSSGPNGDSGLAGSGPKAPAVVGSQSGTP